MSYTVHPYKQGYRSCSSIAAGAAWWQEGEGGAGRVVVLGSSAMFEDKCLGKEDNTGEEAAGW
jgi:hypothetical protein